MVDISYPQLRDDWSLDVVNILAFLGEHNILACSQQICMSWTCFLPRLIPAPQGLLAQRPKKLASEDDTPVTGTHSGYHRPALQYFGRMCHTDGSELPAFTTRVLEISWDPGNEDGSLKSPLRPRLFSPMNLIAMFSCAMSLGLAAWAFVLGDAVALTGILVMSFTTPLLCVGMRWRPESRVHTPREMGIGAVPQGTVVIKSSNECLTVVTCDAYIARLIYFHPEYIDYTVKSPLSRGLSGIVGGLTLVGSIVLFGNAVWTMKAALAVTYTVLNLSYWIAAILPVSFSSHIDLVAGKPQIIESNTFTQCLWTAIYVTKTRTWARQHVPDTGVWNDWLQEAKAMTYEKLSPELWDAEECYRRLLASTHES